MRIANNFKSIQVFAVAICILGCNQHEGNQSSENDSFPTVFFSSAPANFKIGDTISITVRSEPYHKDAVPSFPTLASPIRYPFSDDYDSAYIRYDYPTSAFAQIESENRFISVEGRWRFPKRGYRIKLRRKILIEPTENGYFHFVPDWNTVSLDTFPLQ